MVFGFDFDLNLGDIPELCEPLCHCLTRALNAFFKSFDYARLAESMRLLWESAPMDL
jgi:hypothetical protein